MDNIVEGMFEGWFEAARHGDVEEFSRLLNLGADVDALSQGKTALMRCCRDGLLDGARFLVEAGARLDLADHDGITALMWACWNGAESCARLLVESGADLHAADSDGWSALTHAAARNQSGCVKLLLDGGAFMDDGDLNGFTPSMKAARNGAVESLDRLLSAGADAGARSLDGSCAFSLAAGSGSPKSIECLRLLSRAKGVLKDGCDSLGQTPLMKAASNRSIRALEKVEFLLSIGADPCRVDKQGCDAEALAAAKGNGSVHALLLAAKESRVLGSASPSARASASKPRGL